MRTPMFLFQPGLEKDGNYTAFLRPFERTVISAREETFVHVIAIIIFLSSISSESRTKTCYVIGP